MGIRPEMKPLYPENWSEISRRRRESVGRCEHCGQVGPKVTATGYTENYLTTHHRDHNPVNNSDENLLILCAVCHLAEERRYQQRLRREAPIRRGQLELWPETLSESKTPSQAWQEEAVATPRRTSGHAQPGSGQSGGRADETE